MTFAYVDMAGAAKHLGFVDAKTGRLNARAAREFLDRQKVPMKRRGHSLVVRVDALEATLKDRR